MNGIRPVRMFLQGTLLYLMVGLALVLLVREQPDVVIGRLFSSVPAMLGVVAGAAGVILPLVALAMILVPRRMLVERGARTLATLLAVSVFLTTFTMVKTSLPHVLPFWADPLWAELDRLLHFGTDPWVHTHALLAGLPAPSLAAIYMSVWALPAMFLPVLLVAIDGDHARVQRFMILYVVAWVGLGNVVALAGLSVGPIYYDRLLGGERFADLLAQLQVSGIAGTQVGQVQDMLWQVYAERGQTAGSGISAFPSVHVAMASVVALYAAERLPLGGWIAAALIALYTVLSVHLGWHYAVDGYASTLVIWLVWRRLRRGQAVAPAPRPVSRPAVGMAGQA